MGKCLKELRKRTREQRARIKAAQQEALAKMTPQEKQIYDLKQEEHHKSKGSNPNRDVDAFE